MTWMSRNGRPLLLSGFVVLPYFFLGSSPLLQRGARDLSSPLERRIPAGKFAHKAFFG